MKPTLFMCATTTPAELRTRPSLVTAGAVFLDGTCGAVVTGVDRAATGGQLQVSQMISLYRRLVNR
jgi:predicted naringenin-chalcone synthase